MDEIRLLSESLPDTPPPSPEVTASARSRVVTAAGASGARSRRTPQAGSARRWAWGWTVGAAMATATVVTAVIVLVSSLTTVAAPVLVRPTGIDLLLQIADSAARQPATEGAYWHTKAVDGGSFRTGEPPYTFEAQSTREVWQPRDLADHALTENWTRFVRPASPQDEQAWRAAGAPEKVQPVCAEGDDDCEPIRITDVPSDCSYTWKVQDGYLFHRGVGEFTVDDLRKLPADPERLREALKPYHQIWYDRGFKQSFEEFLPTASSLLELPIEPGTRAALLRLLATLPQTKVHGETVDPLGRPGLSVSFGEEGAVLVSGKEETPIQNRTVLDPTTGAPLADLDLDPTSRVVGYEAIEIAQWTDAAPQEPRNCEKSK
ncbi:CU044_5270 family protein [Nonomuraea dietziae]|uniref:CU044_5270 family protein n=1 Tax=Nonomuraea dietziae TaxID=65515 RepID=UPI0033D4D6F1